MPFHPIPFTVEFVIEATNANGSDEINVLHFYKPTGAVTLTDLTNLASWFDTNVRARWLSVHSNSYHLRSLRLKDLTHDGSYFLDYPFTTSPAGTAGSNPLASGTALALTLQTPFAGRSNRGRIFFGSIDKGYESNDSITPTAVTNFSTLVSYLVGSAGLTGLYLAVASRVNSHSLVVQSFKLNTDLDSQRRRLPGRGR